MSNPYEKLFESIPRTKEEMEVIRQEISQQQGETITTKAFKHNDRIEKARKIVRMFQTEEFANFWEVIYTEMKKLTETSVSQIKGSPAPNQHYDPLGQLAQLNQIQGGVEMLESIQIQKTVFEETAKGQSINIEELKAKLLAVNQLKDE